MTSQPDFSLRDKASAKAVQLLGLMKEPSFLILYSSIWNARSIDKLEQIQQRATKLVPEIAHLPYKARLLHLNLH